MAMNQQLDIFDSLELQARQPNGNKDLVEYGIQTEHSDYRIHVGYKTQHIFVFSTKCGRQSVERAMQENARRRNASVDGNIVTAKGYAIPISSIDGIQCILIPQDIYRQNVIYPKASTTTKGRIATQIVVEMLKRMLIPLPVKIDVADDKAMQIQGTDIIIHSSLRLQVKCDYKAGERKYGGTGNVFLQTHECNPYKLTG